MTEAEHILAVGDIHGCYDKLQQLLSEYVPGLPPNTRLVFLGDYVDRGPQSREVVERLIRLKEERPDTVLLLGNHEHMLLNAHEGRDVMLWEVNGGAETLASYDLEEHQVSQIPPAHIEFMQALELYHETDNYIFVNTVYRASDSTELYLSFGYGFHSNDARGTTISVDPSDGEGIERVDPLVRSRGYELGLRHDWSESTNTSIALWSLDLDSELLYVGDAGNTESSRPSERKGVELASYYSPFTWLTFDLDLAVTDSGFSDVSPDGVEIPGAIDRVAGLGVNLSNEKGWYGSLRYRHFGSRALIEDNSVRSEDFDSFNLRLGFRGERWRASIDVLNLFDSDDHDITYFYESRLEGEALDGVADLHLHRIPPRTLRANLSVLF